MPFIRQPSCTLAMLIFLLGGAGLTGCSISRPPKLEVTVEGLSPEGHLPDDVAFCAPAGVGANRNPGLRWTRGPDAVRSYVVLMADVDVPKDDSKINQEGVTIRSDEPRTKFSHWVLVDIPAGTTRLPTGIDSAGRPAGGKPLGIQPHGLRGQNGYAGVFKNGPYGGYDGPCPPENDERLHRYAFAVYGVNVPSLGLQGNFTLSDVLRAIDGKIVASGQVVATYTLNPGLRKPRTLGERSSAG